MGRFKKGVFLGGLLGAGLVWLHTTKKGKDVRDQILDHAAEVYEEMKGKFMQSDAWKQMTKNQYLMSVRNTVARYALDHELPDVVKDTVSKVLGTQWGMLKRELKKMKK